MEYYISGHARPRKTIYHKVSLRLDASSQWFVYMWCALELHGRLSPNLWEKYNIFSRTLIKNIVVVCGFGWLPLRRECSACHVSWRVEGRGRRGWPRQTQSLALAESGPSTPGTSQHLRRNTRRTYLEFAKTGVFWTLAPFRRVRRVLRLHN